MPILSLSSASLLEKSNLRRSMKYFDATEKIHTGADANQKINFRRPNGVKVACSTSNVLLAYLHFLIMIMITIMTMTMAMAMIMTMIM